jgi:hypothetical protein
MPVDGPYGRFFQIGYVTRDIHHALQGLERMGARQGDLHEDFRTESGEPSAIYALSHLILGAAEIELIQPRLERASIYLEALPEKIGALAVHHIGYLHPDIPAWEGAMRTVRAGGLAVAVEGATSYARFAYLDTRAEVGHYTEVVWREGGSWTDRA